MLWDVPFYIHPLASQLYCGYIPAWMLNYYAPIVLLRRLNPRHCSLNAWQNYGEVRVGFFYR